MSRQNDDLAWTIILGGVVCATIVFGLALVLAAWNAGAQLLSWWVLTTLQILLAIVATAVVLGGSLWLIHASIASLVERLAALERRHGELLRAVGRRAPTFLAIALLTGQVVLLIADKSFPADTTQTVVVSIGLLLGFWVANELQAADSTGARMVGWAVWFVTLAFLPIAIVLSRGEGVRSLVQFVATLDLPTKVFAGVAGITLLCAPLVVSAATRRIGQAGDPVT